MSQREAAQDGCDEIAGEDGVSEDAAGEKTSEVPCRRARGLTTGDLARACATTLRTVRFYEEAGILCPETRSDGGHRLYGPEDLAKLQLVMDLREAGLSLCDIKDLFALKRKHATPEAASVAMQQALGAQIDEMQRKIATLRKLREELAQMVAIIAECRGCESTEFPKNCMDCDVMNRPGLPRAMRLLWSKCPEEP
jgi:MerR family Zn(II)-responsive transcriptional regulator of zntA